LEPFTFGLKYLFAFAALDPT